SSMSLITHGPPDLGWPLPPGNGGREGRGSGNRDHRQPADDVFLRTMEGAHAAPDRSFTTMGVSGLRPRLDRGASDGHGGLLSAEGYRACGCGDGVPTGSGPAG